MKTAKTPSGPSLRVLFVEPQAGGHHFNPYLLNAIRASQSAGHTVSLLTSQSALSHPAAALLQAQVGAALEVHLMPDTAPIHSARWLALLARQYAAYQAIKRGFQSLSSNQRPDFVFVMCFDAIDRCVALLGSPFAGAAFSGLFIGAKFHWPALAIGPGGRAPWIQRFFFRHRLLPTRTLHSLASIDATLLRYFEADAVASAKLRFVPDPGEVQLKLSREDARALLGIESGKQVVLVYGLLSARKNIQTLLRAALHKPTLCVLLAGQAEPEFAAELALDKNFLQLQEAKRLLWLNAYIDSQQEQTVFAAADLVWLCYANSFCGQSAVLVQAASAGRPVLACEHGLIGLTVRKHGLGLCAAADDEIQIQATLQQALAQDADLAASAAPRRAFAQTRSFAEFGAAILACLPKSAGSAN